MPSPLDDRDQVATYEEVMPGYFQTTDVIEANMEYSDPYHGVEDEDLVF